MVLSPAWRRRPSLIRIFQENLASEGFKSKLFPTVQVWVDEQRWCSGRILTFQGIEKGSILVRCENVRLSKLFSSSFHTDELSIPRFSFFHVRVAKHRWWSGSIVAFQAFGMGSILVRGRTYNVDRNFPERLVTQEFRSLLLSSVHIGFEEHRWGSGSLVALEAIDVCSIPVRWRSSNIDGNFAIIFVTKEYTTLMSSLSSVGIEEHHWCSGSTAHLQASDMVLIPAGRRRPSLIRSFQENLFLGRFNFIDITTVQIWVDKHRWCSGSIVAFQAIDVCSIPVRWRSSNIDGKFAMLFVTKEYTTLMSSLSSAGIEEHHWCSGSTAHLQASDMVLIPARRRRPSLIRSFQENLFSGRFNFIDITTVQIWVDKHRWCSGSIVAFQAIDMGSIPVRCRSYNLDGNFAVIFVTKENRTLMLSFSSVGIEEHHWCSGNTAHLQASDMVLIPAWRRRPSLIRSFQENLFSGRFNFIDITTVQIWVDKHRWCSGSIVAFQDIDMGSIPVRCRSNNLDGNFAVIFVTKENRTLMLSFSSVGIEEHHWCSGSTAHLQAIDMGLIPAWRRRPSLITIFQENLASELFKSKMFSTVEIWVDEHLLCSGWIGSFQSIENGSIHVRCKKFRLSKIFYPYLIQMSCKSCGFLFFT